MGCRLTWVATSFALFPVPNLQCPRQARRQRITQGFAVGSTNPLATAAAFGAVGSAAAPQAAGPAPPKRPPPVRRDALWVRVPDPAAPDATPPKFYYFHRFTGVTTWDRPPEAEGIMPIEVYLADDSIAGLGDSGQDGGSTTPSVAPSTGPTPPLSPTRATAGTGVASKTSPWRAALACALSSPAYEAVLPSSSDRLYRDRAGVAASLSPASATSPYSSGRARPVSMAYGVGQTRRRVTVASRDEAMAVQPPRHAALATVVQQSAEYGGERRRGCSFSSANAVFAAVGDVADDGFGDGGGGGGLEGGGVAMFAPSRRAIFSDFGQRQQRPGVALA